MGKCTNTFLIKICCQDDEDEKRVVAATRQWSQTNSQRKEAKAAERAQSPDLNLWKVLKLRVHTRGPQKLQGLKTDGQNQEDNKCSPCGSNKQVQYFVSVSFLINMPLNWISPCLWIGWVVKHTWWEFNSAFRDRFTYKICDVLFPHRDAVWDFVWAALALSSMGKGDGGGCAYDIHGRTVNPVLMRLTLDEREGWWLHFDVYIPPAIL